MTSIFSDLQAAEARWHDLQVEAEHERLVLAALELRRERAPRSFLSRYLKILKRRNPTAPPPDPSKN